MARPSRALTTFAENLRATRARRDLTQEQLAYASGVTAGEVSRMERGIREPRVLTLVKLADALEVGPATLLDGIGRHG
ncbi:helix-turn-helix domain-containing protein [Conexibacter sp. CPCC 206217]|uniref:helix-turn-helix domain-containing protein n=1 Tax=Conexibacter sp. CPCC 206217 TaxID=3064574 RepID=UPI002721E719|nr:helix-turn-helix transcriptional regulator [Conexibacter sp. CPCC 206217]MDO8213616.1 helix-turn-helix transcriptional regulator [Conexibacter sp. CPCC 206217]